MRRNLRTIGYLVLSFSLLDIVIGIIDWYARWEFLKTFMMTYPQIAHFVETPFLSLIFLVLGLSLLWTERRIKEPNIKARYTNSRVVPDLHSVTMQLMIDSAREVPGWDEKRFDWDWFIEVQMANDSETPTTIDDLLVVISTLRSWKNWKKQVFEVRYLEDLEDFDMDMTLNGEGKPHGKRIFGARYQPVSSLMAKIKDTPLRQEIGYRGWLHFKVFQVNQKEMRFNKIKIDIRLIDAMQRSHTPHFKKRDESKWDQTFYISPKVKTK